MKRHTILLLFLVILLNACAAHPYSPAVITSSQIDLSPVTGQTAEPTINNPSSGALLAESECSSGKIPQKSSVASSKTTSSKINSTATSAASVTSVTSVSSASPVSFVVSSKVSPASSSQQRSSNSVISSTAASVPPVTNSQDIEVVSLTSPIVHGQDASITIKGTPGVEYTIKVIYKSGPSQAGGLSPKTADSDGTVKWSWKVGAKTSPGSWSIEISGGGASVTMPFIVTE